ncbi:hypothetical protein SASPL_108393 [Salvia splendens]|uniref:SMP domain-containing protein n=1 Tax=Salvia splendens TaxID=180675 RepID=A0A8X8YD22_SALSN|nr:late embryogenesis abundant protein 47-like [Salvia splendens]KAG6430328.1 hypothetical protein SASPL_108393 [Salvia splendens]
MNQEQPSKHVQDTINEFNAQEAATHPQTSSRKAHSNVVASQKELVGVQGIKEIESSPLGSRTEQRGEITIGEALEATALTAGHRPVDYSDAAAIQAAEVRATGRTNIVPGGVAAAAQSAATRNARLANDEDKTKLGEILSDATSKLPSDKPVTRRDAEGVIGAELRNDPNLCTRPGGVAASIAAAARLNQTNASINNQNKTN